MNKRFLCILLTLMMLLTVIPIGTMAAYAASYTVTVVINGEGSVTYTPEQPEPGDTLTVTATADDGWAISKFTFEDSETELSSITYNSSDWTEDSNDFIMPEDNVTITVDFIKADEIPDKVPVFAFTRPLVTGSVIRFFSVPSCPDTGNDG